MTRTYELGIIVEPRQGDEQAQEIVDKYKDMIEASGAKIDEVDFWGKRKLAYPIRKFKEGNYAFIYVEADGRVPWPDIERLLMQDEAVLRHLVVRTDQDLKRAARKAKVQPERIRPQQSRGGEGRGDSRR